MENIKAPSRPDISLIVALYYEQECVEEYVRQVRLCLDEEDVSYEIVFTDDGSQDRTIPIVEALAKEDPRIKLVQLARNYGKEVAVTAGIEHASGEYMIMMDVDLQDPPDRIMDFYRKIQEGYDLVFGIRKKRNAALVTRLLSKLFWASLNVMTGLKIPVGISVMRIFNRKFREEFLRHKESVRFIEGLFVSIGLRQTTLPVENRERFAGTTKFNLHKRIKLAINAMLAFSDRPLEIGTGLGMFMVACSSLSGVYFLVRKLVFDLGLSGWTSTVLFIMFIGGVHSILLGIIGAYIGRIYTEVKSRPLYGVQRRLNFEENDH